MLEQILLHNRTICLHCKAVEIHKQAEVDKTQ